MTSSRRRSAPPAKAARTTHARIQREAAKARADVAACGVSLPQAAAPALVELYHSARAAVVCARGRSGLRSFGYLGVRYPLEYTNFGRLRVLCPTTHELLISGPIGDLW